jgi:tRNA pseudouridine55 synthase
MDGFLNLDKPFGFTSHDCVAKVRRLLHTKKVGHAGTLDPAATGVLPIAIGRATRLLQYLPQGKAYRATVRFGLTTATDDLEGEVLTETDASALTLATIEPQLPQFLGQIDQIPPSYSAIQVDGQRLYHLARSGQMITAPLRQVEVLAIEILDWRPGLVPELDLAISCGPGTYIRAIARDLGSVLGVGATLAALCRTTSSGFDQATSLTFDQLAEQVEQETFQVLDPIQALISLPPIILP